MSPDAPTFLFDAFVPDDREIIRIGWLPGDLVTTFVASF